MKRPPRRRDVRNARGVAELAASKGVRAYPLVYFISVWIHLVAAATWVAPRS